MLANQRVVAIIPARGGSKRLLHKNIYPVLGKPMLQWAIEACRQSKYIDDVVASTDDPAIAKVAREAGAIVIKRPTALAGDLVFKQAVIVHATKWLEKSNKHATPDIVISLQPNSPEIKAGDLDAAMEKLMQYKRQEIFSVGPDLLQNAAFRIMTKDTVFQKSLSTNCGVYVCDYLDVHTIEDVKAVETRGNLK